MISQEAEYTESVFYHPTFLRVIFRKATRKTVILNSPLLREERTFHDVPRTHVKFDPYVIAPFEYEEPLDIRDLDEETQVAILYMKGLSMPRIGEQFKPKKHRMQVARLLRKFLKNRKKMFVTSHIHKREG